MASTAHLIRTSQRYASAIPWERAVTERGLRQLLAGLCLPVVVHDGGLILEVTRGVGFTFACPSEELAWTQLADWVTAPSRLVLEDYLRRGAGSSVRLEGLRKDGAAFPFEFTTRAALVFRGRRVQVSTLCELSEEPEPVGVRTGARAEGRPMSGQAARLRRREGEFKPWRGTEQRLI